MEPVYFRWNGDRKLLKNIDGYFLPGGFAYEDRGRSGMVAARDPLLDHIRGEAAEGKTVIGVCNGAQVLVESGLIPNGDGLQISLAHNAIKTPTGFKRLPFLSEWIWITRSCEKGRCAADGWDGVMHIPLAHGEGRYTTTDASLIKALQENDQLAFSYCDTNGKISEDVSVTPNGATLAIAGLCNPEGNVVALMPHPERAREGGQPFFNSIREWIVAGKGKARSRNAAAPGTWSVPARAAKGTEIFIETIIVNNEERTVEQAGKRVAPALRLKQWKYLSVPDSVVKDVLADLTVFNANKERAIVRRGQKFSKWDASSKKEEALAKEPFDGKRVLLRRDIPDTSSWGAGSETGVAYGIEGVVDNDLQNRALLEVFGNPHSSTLEFLR
jgi:phosphoribosylformylglycinamidine synthase